LAKVYVLINAIEYETSPNNITFFSTNFVFNQSGCIVSRYRKEAISFDEKNRIELKSQVETSDVYDQFLCETICVKSEINDECTLQSSRWMSSSPFMNIHQIQERFVNKVVFLMVKIDKEPVATLNEKDNFKLPITKQESHKISRNYDVEFADISCSFTLKYMELRIPQGKLGIKYRLARSGTKSDSIFCSIVPCNDENDANTCGENFLAHDDIVPSVNFLSIEIKMVVKKSSSERTFMQIPTEKTVTPNKTENGYEYIVQSTMEGENLLSFGIFGGSGKKMKSRQSFLQTSFLLVVFTVSIIIYR
jgi:hypothetical protein